jgi:hypothetical protein
MGLQGLANRKLEEEVVAFFLKKPLPSLVAVTGALAVVNLIRDPASIKKVGEWGTLARQGAETALEGVRALVRFATRKRMYTRIIEHQAPAPSSNANAVYVALNWYLSQWATRPAVGTGVGTGVAGGGGAATSSSIRLPASVRDSAPPKVQGESATQYLFSEDVMKAGTGVPELQTAAPVAAHQFIMWQGFKIVYARGQTTRPINIGDKTVNKDIYTITLSCETESAVQDFVRGVLGMYAEFLVESAKRIQYYTLQRGNTHSLGSGALTWKAEPFNNLRTLESIALPEGCDLIAHVREFQDHEDWYKARGLPYKLVVLLHGPPGTGKSVTANAICNFLRRSKCNLSLQDLKTDQDLFAVRSAIDVRQVVFVIDDCDAHVNSLLQRSESLSPPDSGPSGLSSEPTPGELLMAQASAMQAMALSVQNATTRGGAGAAAAPAGAGSGSISLAGFLQFLDGHGADGMVVVMTTNMKDKLDRALWRSCRVDYCLEMPEVTPAQVKHLYRLFYSGLELPDDKLPDLARHTSIVSADIEAVFREFKFKPAEAAEALARYVPARGVDGAAAPWS